MTMRNGAVGVRNRIAMGIVRRPSKHRVDPLDEPIGHDVLQLFGLVVHLVPAHAHHLHEKKLDEPVTTEHERGEFVARLGEADTAVRFVLDKA